MAQTGTRSEAQRSFFVFVRDSNTGEITRMAIPADTQIGMVDNPAELQLFGRLSVNATEYNVTTANAGIINASNDDTIISVNLVSAPGSDAITVNLPSTPREGQLHFIKDTTETNSTVPITVSASGGSTIDGEASITFAIAGGSLLVAWFNDGWHILANGTGSGGGNTVASYVTVNHEAALPNSRQIVATGITTITDNGPGSTLVINTPVQTGSGITINGAGGTSVSGGPSSYVVSSSIGADRYAQVILVSGSNAFDFNARIVAGTGGISIVDNGAGNTIVWELTPPINPGAGVDGMLCLLPNTSPSGWPNQANFFTTCANSASVTGIFGGVSGTLYDASFRFRGVIEINGGYTGGQNDGNYWQVGGTIPVGTSNVVYMSVSNPSGTYILNRTPNNPGTINPPYVFTVDYTKTVPVYAGATISVWMWSGWTPDNTANLGQMDSNGYSGHPPISVPSIGLPAQPYDGQFMLLNYVTSSMTSTIASEIFVKSGGNLLPSGTYAQLNFISGVFAKDHGDGLTADVWADPSVLAFLISASFTGPISGPTANFTTFSGSFTGSLTQTGIPGLPAIVGLGIVTSTTTSHGQVILSGAIPQAVGLGGVAVTTESQSYFTISSSLVTVAATGGTSLATGGGTTYTLSSSAGADLFASYLTVTPNAFDPKARQLVAGTNVGLIDGGPGGTLTITAATGTVGMYVEENGVLVGEAFYQTLNFEGGVTVTDGGAGVANINVTGGGSGGVGQWTDGGGKLYTTGSVAIDSMGSFANQFGTDVYFYVSGTVGLPPGNPDRLVSVLATDVVASGSMVVNLNLAVSGGLTGSLTRLASGNPYMIATGTISLSSNSLGQVSIGDFTISSGPSASMPPEGTPGRLYLPTDGNTILEDNGVAWRQWGPITPITPPVSGTGSGSIASTVISGSAATLTWNNAGLLITAPGAASQVNWFFLQQQTNTTSGSVEVGFTCDVSTTTSNVNTNRGIFAGAVFRNSTTGVGYLCGLNFVYNTTGYQSYIFAGAGAGQGLIGVPPTGNYFFKVALVGTNIVASISRDRVNYITIASQAISSVIPGLTTSNCFCGIVINEPPATTDTGYTNVFHYAVN